MSTILLAAAASDGAAGIGCVNAGASPRLAAWWRSFGLLLAAPACAGAALLLSPALPGPPSLDLGMGALAVFAVGLARMTSVALIGLMSGQRLSPAERRSRLVSSAIRTGLFIPVALLARYVV
jgi:hypothetical protein